MEWGIVGVVWCVVWCAWESSRGHRHSGGRATDHICRPRPTLGFKLQVVCGVSTGKGGHWDSPLPPAVALLLGNVDGVAGVKRHTLLGGRTVKATRAGCQNREGWAVVSLGSWIVNITFQHRRHHFLALNGQKFGACPGLGDKAARRHDQAGIRAAASLRTQKARLWVGDSGGG